jgi:hypothetical protein
MVIQNDDIALLTGVGAMVTEVRDNESLSKADIGKLRSISTTGATIQIKTWGNDNQLPVRREELIDSSNIVPSLLSTKLNITVGGDLFAYRERYQDNGKGETRRIVDEVQMPSAQEDFFDACRENRYFDIAGGQFFKHGNIFTEMIPAKAASIFGKEQYIASLKGHEAKFIRAERQNTEGVIENYYFRGNAWGKTGPDRDFPIKRIRTFNPKGDMNRPSLYHTGESLLKLDDYYYSPVWWGARQWISLANIIPQFHQANLRNGYTIRFHIRIPKNYFDDPEWRSGATSTQKVEYEKTRKQRKEAFLKTLNEFLTGVEQTGRAIVTEYVVDAVKGQFPGVEIIPIEVNLQDKALLDLFEKANQASMAAMQLHPTLSNIETAGKLSSGTEIRNAYLMYIGIQTAMPRRTILEPVYAAAKVNGWDRTLKYGFRDAELTKLSEDKSGMKSMDVAKNN